MSRLRLAAAALVAVAAAGSGGAAATPRSSPFLLSFGLEPGLGVCATDLEGHTFRLADPRQSGLFLSWSPDGSQLVFRSGQSRVSFVDAEGHNRGGMSWPSTDGENFSTSVGGFAWSPDSRGLAWVLTTAIHYGGVHSQLWVSRGATRAVHSGGVIGQPSWSPDGSRIAFSDWTTSTAYVIDPEGRNLQEILDSAAQPVWSPDGQRLAYVALDADRQSVGLAVARADGSDQQRLTDGRVLSPAWSPDGSTIAFTRNLGTSNEIDVINADGTGERRVAGAAALYPGPAWSPDGGAIAYTRDEQPARLGVVRPDGASEERIVETGLPGGGLSSAAWRRTAPLPRHRRACVITGTPQADVLRGKNRGDVLFGGAGNDRLYGAGGKDVLFGGSGRDRLFGVAGNDLFNTRDAKRDYLSGGPGTDWGNYDLYRDRVKSVERYLSP